MFAFLLSVAAMAVPARRGTFTVTQSDGTVITLRLMGDEYFHYYQNVATGEKMLQGSDGDYYVVAESELSNRSEKAQTRRTAANAARAKRLPKHVVSTDGRKKVGTINSVTGQKKGLVILVNFSDKSMASGHNQSAFDNMFNQVGYNQNGHIGSVHDYFYDQSYGKLNLTFDVVGPVTVSKSMSYYGGNDSNDNDMYPATMVIEACRLVNSQVNFADYDWDGDEKVEQVYVIYAGYAESQGASDDTIWPHEWQLSDAASYNDGTGALTLDGVKIDTYACSSELCGTSGTTLSGIGTACHEFSHCLGFPDFYDTSSEGSGVGMSYFDVLDGGSYNGPNGDGEVPCGYTAYERYEAGWLEPEFLDDYSEVENMPALTDEARAYILFNGDDTDDYVLIENRQSKSWFRYFNDETAGHGLFVTHVQYDKEAWESNEVNTNASNQRMTWIPADGSQNKSTHTADFYPGTGNEDSFYCFNHSLTHISESSEKISFVIDERYTVTFDPGTGTCGTTSLTQSEYLEAINLPKCTPPDGWSFKGWSTEVVNSTTSYPSLVYSPYPPTGNVTLYAVYSNSTSGTGSSNTFEYVTAINSGSDYVFVTKNTAGDAYMLDSSNLSKTSSNKSATATSVTVSANGEKFVIENPSSSAIWTLSVSNSNLKAKNGSYYLKINGSGAALSETESSVYWNGNTGLYGKSGSGTTSYYTQYSNTNNTVNFTFSNTTGSSTNRVYLYKRAGSSSSTTYATYPNGEGLAKPVITFPSSTRSMFVGDVDDTFTATVSNSTGAISYDSSNPLVATVGPETGRVVAKEAGTTKITATVAAVSGVSISSKASYTLTVSMPELVSITVTTPPTKTTYMEGEKFSTEGIVVTASYANGYKEDITTSCQYSISSTTSLTTDITCITISFTEKYGDHDITVTTTQPIAVTPLPKYKVTFNAGSGTCSTTSLSESEYQGGVVLPSATSVSDEWAFAGWSTASVNATNTRPELHAAGATYKPATDITLYAVYSLSETSGGSGNYELVTEELSDWSGDYLIAAADNIFADGRLGGKDEGKIGGQNTAVNPGSNLSGNTVAAEWGDTYHVTLEPISGGYALKTQDGVYNYRLTENGGIDTSATTEGLKPIVVKFTSNNDIILRVAISEKETSCPSFQYNKNNDNATGGWFRFYKADTQEKIYLYKKQGTLVAVTYNSNPSSVPLAVPEVNFFAKSTTMKVGDEYIQKATVKNSTGTVHYSSSDTKIATVDETTGKVTATGVGTVTITAFVDAVAGVSKSASATYIITISMPVLTSLAIATPATKTAFQEGEAFISAGLSLTATYRNGYSQTLTLGFTTSPAEGEALAAGTNSVTVSYTEGSVTKTVSYAITVAELPKYAVHFMSNGRLVETITETIANNGVVAPPMNDVTLTVDGEKLTYEFVGWTKTNAARETTSKPTVLTFTDGKYLPTEETTLYALYMCTTGNFAQGFTLNLTNDGTTYYVGNVGKDKLTSTSIAASALTLYYDSNCLWYVDSNTRKAKYLYGSSTKADINGSDSKQAQWEMAETKGIVTLTCKVNNISKVLALNPNSTDIVRLYGTSYPYQWNLTYTDETYSLGSTTVYTCYPEVNIVTIANMIDRLKKDKKTQFKEQDVIDIANKVLKIAN